MAVDVFRTGGLVVVVDDEDRENEGDLICAAATITPDDVAFIVRHTSGIVCVPMSPTMVDRLGIPQMTRRNRDPFSTAFTVSVDARRGVTTGVSAADRAHTIRLLADPHASADDLVTPGHVFPLRAAENGVLDRRGHTEAALDLARLAGVPEAGVLAELVNDDGTMMRGPELRAFADDHQLPLISIADLAAHRE
ncbi:3,4-dihydroxy-2-butanone-4-phosphate synthase [Actinophytocola sp.]|uniref:3,4-dihydroxy-2-butanone-4-phosphate synthase n=1 Tax=Actinophytocola sp. TaxID=1872138 RepID=UPI0039C855A0